MGRKSCFDGFPLSRSREGRVRARWFAVSRCDSLVLRSCSVDKKGDSHPCGPCRPPWSARGFLLLVQEKVTKENTPSMPRRRCAPVRYGPRHRGFKSEAKALGPAFAGTTRLCAFAFAPASRVPLGRGEGAKEIAAQRWPAGGRPVRCQATDGLSANLRSALAKSRDRRSRDRGREGALLLVTSPGQAREVTRPPGWRTKPHTVVSRFSSLRRR
jgi:hypothetical protein